jgi:hypothetical protein
MLEACRPTLAQLGIAQQTQPLHIFNLSGRDLPVNRPEPNASALLWSDAVTGQHRVFSGANVRRFSQGAWRHVNGYLPRSLW